MVAGALAFVLHGHLPYVRSRHPGSLEEDWFFQALTESYLPLIEMLQRSLQQGAQPRLTMSLSPTLLSLLVDPVLQERYEPWLQQRIDLLERSSSDEQAAAADLSQHLERQRLVCSFGHKRQQYAPTGPSLNDSAADAHIAALHGSGLPRP